MTEEQRKLPAPDLSPETEEFWKAASEGTLLVRYCRSCEAPHHYPRTICPHCGSDDTYYQEASGLGTIYAYSVMHRVQPRYAIAYVQLEGTDIKMMTNIVDCDMDNLSIGQQVKVKFVESEGDGPPLPCFTPI